MQSRRIYHVKFKPGVGYERRAQLQGEMIRQLARGPTGRGSPTVQQLAAAVVNRGAGTLSRARAGLRSRSTRNTALQALRNVPAQDQLGELAALQKWVRNNVRYTYDPYGVELFQSPESQIRDLRENGVAGADCLPLDTPVVREDYSIAQMVDLNPGDRILGRGGQPTEVLATAIKGWLPTLNICLNNGGLLTCTPDHKLVLGDGTEIRAGELTVGTELATSHELPIQDRGVPEPDPDLYKLVGLHVADGWTGYGKTGKPRDFSISGKDGKPKEAQKKWVEQQAEQRGWSTRWHERYLTIKPDEKTLSLMASCGRRAPNKHVPRLNALFKEEITALVEAWKDPEAKRIQFSTTSSELAIQFRLLHKMLGKQVSMVLYHNHGGLGRNPIWRLDVRNKTRPVRVKSISQGETQLVMDIETANGGIYLPETDIVVHNCDDLTALYCGMASAVGYPTAVMITGTGRYEHVLPGVAPLFPEDLGAEGQQLQKSAVQGWIPAELTLDVPLGWRNPSWNRWKILEI